MDLPFHAIVGIIGTLFFWLVCSVLGETIASSVLVVPGIFLLFYVAIGFWTDQIITANTPPPPPGSSCLKPTPDVCPTPPPVEEEKCEEDKDVSGNDVECEMPEEDYNCNYDDNA